MDTTLPFKVFNALINSIILDFGITYYIGNNEDKFENFIPAATRETLGTGNSATTVHSWGDITILV